LTQAVNIENQPNLGMVQVGSPDMGMASHDAILAALAQKYRNEGYKQALEVLNFQLRTKDEEIFTLTRELNELKAKMTSTNTSSVTVSNVASSYSYDSAKFPKPNGDIIIRVLIMLVDERREKNRYIINLKTDWYLVWKVLHYFKVYIGNEYDFMDIVNECVLPNYSDNIRKEDLSLDKSNFYTINNEHPLKKYAVHYWRQDYEHILEKGKGEGLNVLERGINIKMKLQELLLRNNVKIANAEVG